MVLFDFYENDIIKWVEYPTGEKDCVLLDYYSEESVRYFLSTSFYVRHTFDTIKTFPTDIALFNSLVENTKIWYTTQGWNKLDLSDTKVDVVIGYLPMARSDKTNRPTSTGAYLYKNLNELRLSVLDCHCDASILHKTCDILSMMHRSILPDSYSPMYYTKPKNAFLDGLFTNYDYIILADKSANRSLSFLIDLKDVGIFDCDAGSLYDTLIQATKERNQETGQLSNFDFSSNSKTKFTQNQTGGNVSILVVDDICDGGGTFIPIVNNLKNYFDVFSVDLYVTHGLFTKGVDLLKQYYGNIYTTDTIKHSDDIKNKVHVLPLFD